jgi:hypothetical protein
VSIFLEKLRLCFMRLYMWGVCLSFWFVLIRKEADIAWSSAAFRNGWDYMYKACLTRNKIGNLALLGPDQQELSRCADQLLQTCFMTN